MKTAQRFKSEWRTDRIKNAERDFYKVKFTIHSCRTVAHIMSAKNFINLFIQIHKANTSRSMVYMISVLHCKLDNKIKGMQWIRENKSFNQSDYFKS